MSSSSNILKKTSYRGEAVVLEGSGAGRFRLLHFKPGGDLKPASSEDGEAPARSQPETARHQAERLVAEAEARAAQIMRNAMEAGYLEGRAEGLRAAEEQCADYLKRLAELAHQAIINREKMVKDTEEELAALAIAIAEKVLRRQIAIDPSVVLSLVESALEKVPAGDSVQILAHPDDVDFIKSKWSEVRGAVAFGPNWELVPDEKVGRGGCIIQTRGGMVDGRIQVQLAEILSAFEDGS